LFISWIDSASAKQLSIIMNVIQRARESGRCPPSLLRDEPKEDTFEAAVAKVLDASGTFVARDIFVFLFVSTLSNNGKLCLLLLIKTYP
jgi:hypothetical protein